MSQTIPEQITELSKQYALLYRGGDPDQLLAIAKRVADLAHEVPIEAGAAVAEHLYAVAQSYSRTGNYATALALLEKVLEMRRAGFGPEHPTVPPTLHNVALTHGFMGRYAVAEPLLLEARELGRRVLGENHPEYVKIVDSLGVFYSRTGNYAAAELLLQQAVALKREVFGPDHPSYAVSVNNLALLYDRMGRYDEAEPLYHEALESRRATLGETHPEFAHSLSNLATLYVELGNYAAAESLLQQALDIAVAFFGENHPDVSLYLNNLAGLHARTGNHSEALRLHQVELRILERVSQPDDPTIAVTLNNMALLYERTGDYNTAEDFYWRALRIQYQALGPNHPDLATTNNNLARFFALALGDIVRAESMLQNVLAIRRRVLGEGHPDMAQSLVNLATLYHHTGNYAAAEPLYRQALEITRAVFGDHHHLLAKTVHQLSSLALATGRPDEALTLAKQATAIDDYTLGHLFAFGSERRRTTYLNNAMSEFFRVLSAIREVFSDVPDVVQWALELVWKRKAIGAEALAVQRDAVLSGRYPALQPKLRELLALRAQIARKSLDGPGPEGPQTYRQTLSRWKAEQDRLEAELAREIPEMNLEGRLSAASRKAVAEALPPGSALVEFVRFPIFDFQAKPARRELRWRPDRYVAFVLLAGEPDNVAMIDLGEATAIEGLIDAYRAAITGETENAAVWPPAPEIHTAVRMREAALRAAIFESMRHLRIRQRVQRKTDLQLGIALRKALFDPLVPALDGRTRLFLAPDGDLARLPFEVLPLDNEGFFLDAYEVSYLGVGRDGLLFGHSTTGQPAAPLVAADPDFDLHSAEAPATSPGTPFRHLGGTRVEGIAVADRLQVRPWLQEQVLEAPLKATRSPRIMHLATHGFFRPDPFRDLNTLWSGLRTEDQEEHPLANPLLRSGLVLAGANTWLHKGALSPEAEDGFLTAEDVTGLDLLDTEMVVLSACETGLGDVRVGEGVFGLRRAFMLAGAKTLVMSLWKVPDKQTRLLMELFYENLLEKGLGRAEALRQAQLVLRRQYPKQPFYWGAFICQGNPGPLQGAGHDGSGELSESGRV